MPIERLMVPGEPVPFSHYCHVVKARGQIFLSGAVGIAPDGSIPELQPEEPRALIFDEDRLAVRVR